MIHLTFQDLSIIASKYNLTLEKFIQSRLNSDSHPYGRVSLPYTMSASFSYKGYMSEVLLNLEITTILNSQEKIVKYNNYPMSHGFMPDPDLIQLEIGMFSCGMGLCKYVSRVQNKNISSDEIAKFIFEAIRVMSDVPHALDSLWNMVSTENSLIIPIKTDKS